MKDWLVLIMEAPLMSFGGPMIDQHGVTRADPGLALLTGLISNALGYEHREAGKIAALQTRLRHASLHLRDGKTLIDFHTVDLGQDSLRSGWTTRGTPQGRDGGSAAMGTHIRYRHYLADAARLIVLTLTDPGEPDLDRVELALREPARPLFLGRKTCLPSRPLLAGRIEADTPLEALRRGHALTLDSGAAGVPVEATGLIGEWPAEGAAPPLGCRLETLIDQRDWRNQIHGGERRVITGPLPAAGDGA